MPKLRANLKAAAGRSNPVRFSPATAPATPTTHVPAVLCPGTFMADQVRIAGSAQSAAEKAAGKKVATSTPIRSAEATANDAARIIAIKKETAEVAKPKLGGSTSLPNPAAGGDTMDARHTLQTMRDGTKSWYQHMRTLQDTLQGHLEVRQYIVVAPDYYVGKTWV